MGRKRSSQQQAQGNPQTTEEQIAAIAAALTAGVSVAALAGVLMSVLQLAAFVGSAALARMVAEEVVKIGLRDVPEASTDPSPILVTTAFEQIAYRAAYLRAAVARLANKVREAGRRDTSIQEAVEQWRAAEERFFQLHLEQAIRRQAGAQVALDAIARYGEVVGWYATLRPTNRPHHRAAHRHNFRPLAGPPIQTGAYPSVLPHCLCFVGPPIPGAAEIR